ncbi:thioesterase family protein [Agathobaculum butyriciproducens]
MQVGIKGEKKFTVTKDQLACNVGSGLVSVFATPMMIAAIENTCCRQCGR